MDHDRLTLHLASRVPITFFFINLQEQTFFLVIQFTNANLLFLYGKTMRHEIPSIMEVKHTENHFHIKKNVTNWYCTSLSNKKKS